MRKWIFVLLAALMLVGIGCDSAADKAAKNVSKKCEQFQCQRRIIGVNGITDKVEFLAEGRCSIEGEQLGALKTLMVMCKQGPDEYKKHYVGMSDNMFFVSTQLKPLDVSEYHTLFVLKPENIVPDFDLVHGEQP